MQQFGAQIRVLNANMLQATLSAFDHHFTPSTLEMDERRMGLRQMFVHRLIVAQSRPTRLQFAVRGQFMRMSQQHMRPTIVQFRVGNQTNFALKDDFVDLR